MSPISPVIVNIRNSEKRGQQVECLCELTSSLKIVIFCAGAAFFPALSVSPAHGFASTLFSFRRSPNDPILSHPLAGSDTAGWLADESVSEKIAIFGFPDFVFAGPAAAGDGCCACGSLDAGAAAENGSTLAANAGRTAGSAGEDGPLS